MESRFLIGDQEAGRSSRPPLERHPSIPFLPRGLSEESFPPLPQRNSLSALTTNLQPPRRNRRLQLQPVRFPPVGIFRQPGRPTINHPRVSRITNPLLPGYPLDRVDG